MSANEITVTAEDLEETQETQDTESTPEVTDAPQEETQESNEGLSLETESESEEQELLAGKFKDSESLEKAYLELQKKLGAKDTESPKETEGTEESQEATDNKVTETLQAASDHFWETGELNQDHKDSLMALGLPEALIDQHVAATQAQRELYNRDAESYESKVYELAGGQEAYTELASWAKENWSNEQRDAYNEAVKSGNIALAQIALRGLQSEFTEGGGQAPQLIEGVATPSTVGTYDDWEQAQVDFQDPRYYTDAQFRAEVERKVARSRNLSGGGNSVVAG